MTAPVKPWEMAGVNNREVPAPGIQSVTDSNRLQSSEPISLTHGIPAGTPLNVRRVRTVPAPPPRPTRHINRHNYIPNTSGYYTPHTTYGGYGSTGYGGYSGFGGYGSSYGGYGSIGGYGMNRFGYNLSGNDPESRFIQMAEESSRPAFQSIESLVHAFGSVSFMLESTFNAVYGSFRAVLSVAENFGRLRTLFGQFFSTFAVLRTLQWLYKKLLYLLGLRRENPIREAFWQQAADGTSELAAGIDSKQARTSWPILVFMGVMFSGPYLVWKLLSSLSSSVAANPYNPNEWKQSKEPAYTALALYDFQAASEQELSFRAGQKLKLAPKDLQPRGTKGWILATPDGRRVGLIPYNYIKLLVNPSQLPRPPPVPGQATTLPPDQEPFGSTSVESPVSTVMEQTTTVTVMEPPVTINMLMGQPPGGMNTVMGQPPANVVLESVTTPYAQDIPLLHEQDQYDVSPLTETAWISPEETNDPKQVLTVNPGNISNPENKS